MKKIVKMKKKAVRNVTKSSFTAHADPMFGKQKILKFKDLAEFNAKILMLNTFTPSYQSHLIPYFNHLLGKIELKTMFLKKLKEKVNYFSHLSFCPRYGIIQMGH